MSRQLFTTAPCCKHGHDQGRHHQHASSSLSFHLRPLSSSYLKSKCICSQQGGQTAARVFKEFFWKIGISNSSRHLWCELKYWSVSKLFSCKPFSCKLECKLVLHTLPWDYSPLFMWIVLAGLRGTRPFIFPNHSAAEEEILRKNPNFDLHDSFGDIIILISVQRNCHRYSLAKKFNSCVPYFRCLTPKPISFSRVEEKNGATEETD